MTASTSSFIRSSCRAENSTNRSRSCFDILRAYDLFQIIAHEQQTEHIVGDMVNAEMEKHPRKQPVIFSFQDSRRITGSVPEHKISVLRVSHGGEHQKDKNVGRRKKQIHFVF